MKSEGRLVYYVARPLTRLIKLAGKFKHSLSVYMHISIVVSLILVLILFRV